jgi:signal transduction histidine kinase
MRGEGRGPEGGPPDTHAEPEPAGEGVEPSADPTLGRPPPAVLLVDDRPENLLAFEAVLKPLGARLLRASNAEQALRQVDAQELAVILLDVQMPGTDGLEAARLIKARERGRIVPILFVTALDHDRRRVTSAYQAGAVDYLFKPIDPDELRAKVAAFLDLYRLHGEDRERRRRYADRLVHSSEARYRAAAAESARALAALAESDRAKNEFLSRISHELRTPLNAIIGYAQLLDLGILGAVTTEQHAYLNRVRESAVHLLGLVNDLMNLVTLDPAGTDVRAAHEVGHMGEVCAAALTLVRIEAAERNLTVESAAADGPGVAYVGDPHRVRQVLVHLLTNALKFTRPGGRIALTCGTAEAIESDADGHGTPDEQRDRRGPWAYVRVTDSGIGIEADDLRRIFDPFVQIDGGHTRTEGGTGLGLTISRRLARAMGGEVTVHSRSGSGSTFTLWLPAPPPSAIDPGAARDEGVDRSGSRDTDVDDTITESHAQAATGYPELAVLGSALASGVEAIVRQHAARLRTDRSLPNVRSLPEAQLRDHMSTLVGEIAHVLVVTGETEGRAPELLRDGSEILRLVSELHGVQRYRLGWREEHFAHELALLHTELVAALRQAARESAVDGDVLTWATDLVQRLLDQSGQMSLHGFRRARSGGAM